MTREVVVIGAGMAGLTVAALRAAAGDRVTVVDKGRRHGGRMATRRIDGTAYDTGVASFAVRSPSLRAEVEAWVAAGRAIEVDGEPGRFRGTPTMRALPTGLAEDCGADVRLATTVVGLEARDGRWEVTVEEGLDASARSSLAADALVLTAPAPQSAALLRTSGGTPLAAPSTVAMLDAVHYVPCLAVLVRPATDSPVAPHTILADAASSAAHLDGDRTAAAAAIAAERSVMLGVPLEVVHVHGWRYAQVPRGIDAPALRDDTSGAPLVLAGDLFEARGDAPDGDRIEGVERAFHSGRAGAGLLDAGTRRRDSTPGVVRGRRGDGGAGMRNGEGP